MRTAQRPGRVTAMSVCSARARARSPRPAAASCGAATLASHARWAAGGGTRPGIQGSGGAGMASRACWPGTWRRPAERGQLGWPSAGHVIPQRGLLAGVVAQQPGRCRGSGDRPLPELRRGRGWSTAAAAPRPGWRPPPATTAGRCSPSAVTRDRCHAHASDGGSRAPGNTIRFCLILIVLEAPNTRSARLRNPGVVRRKATAFPVPGLPGRLLPTPNER